jgi:hypothetical protein
VNDRLCLVRSQSFSKRLFDILECHYSRIKEVLAIQQQQKYKRHRPETTLLYQLVERYYPEFAASLAEQGKHFPNMLNVSLMSSCVVADLSTVFYAWYAATANMKS